MSFEYVISIILTANKANIIAPNVLYTKQNLHVIMNIISVMFQTGQVLLEFVLEEIVLLE